MLNSFFFTTTSFPHGQDAKEVFYKVTDVGLEDRKGVRYPASVRKQRTILMR